MSRRIVFAGGIQTRALARVYRSEVGTETGDDVVFIGSGALGTEAARSAMLLADVIAAEIDEDGDAVPADDLPSQAELVRIPNLYADFLWPFAGRAHPRNRGAFALPGGPYPAEHGDRFLDQMMAEGVHEDEAVRRYLALDVVREGELDSRLEDRLAIQRRLDTQAGFDMAGFIAENFRARALFRTRQRMTLKLVRRLLRQLLPKLGVRGFNPERVRRVPFPPGSQPVHPGVALHFGLRWVTPAQRYPVNEEGFFTFEEYCRRYMRFAWNEALHRGIQTAKTNPAEAFGDLERGLALSPDSPLGRRAMAISRHALGMDAVLPADLVIDEESYELAKEALSNGAGTRYRVQRPATRADDPLHADAAVTGDDAAAPPETTEAPPADAEAGTVDAEAGVADVEAGTVDAEAGVAGAPAPEPDEAGERQAEPFASGEPIAADADGEADHDAATDQVAESRAEDAALDALRTRFAPPGGSAPPASIGLTADGFTDFGPPPGRGEQAPAAPPAPPQRAPSAPTPHHAYGVTADGFTDFGRPPEHADQPSALVVPTNDLIDVLPRLLPVFDDMSGAVERPFAAMPEIMPPPPLRPILPPELQSELPKQGLFSRLLGRKATQ